MIAKLDKVKRVQRAEYRKARQQSFAAQTQALGLAYLYTFICAPAGTLSTRERGDFMHFMRECWSGKGNVPQGDDLLPASVSEDEVRKRTKAYLSVCRPSVVKRKALLRALSQITSEAHPGSQDSSSALMVVTQLLQVGERAMRSQSGIPRPTRAPQGAATRTQHTTAARSRKGEARVAKNPAMPPCYELLGCTEEDSDEVIKRAYRRLAAVLHPDRYSAQNLSAERMQMHQREFQQLQDAYEEVKRLRLATKVRGSN